MFCSRRPDTASAIVQAMKDISAFIAGFQRFRAKYFGTDRTLFSELSQKQTPPALVISCCDSRVDPAMLTGADPGDLFIVRNVANLVPPYIHGAVAPGIRSAIEFAVKGLNVEHIIVLGHSGCGGIQALMSGEEVTEKTYEFIGSWVNIAKSAREQVLRDLPGQPQAIQATACEHAAILLSLQNLLTFPWVRERVANNKLKLHGWYFDIKGGTLSEYSDTANAFVPLAGDTN